MSRILRAAFLFNFATAILAGVLLAQLGMEYMDPEIGHGLHPVLAFGGVAICACMALIAASLTTRP